MKTLQKAVRSLSSEKYLYCVSSLQNQRGSNRRNLGLSLCDRKIIVTWYGLISANLQLQPSMVLVSLTFMSI